MVEANYDPEEDDLENDDMSLIVNDDINSPNYGSIIGVDIIQQIGYDDVPRLNIKSKTGVNAILRPVMKVRKRVGYLNKFYKVFSVLVISRNKLKYVRSSSGQYEIFGQKLLIETGGNKVGFPGSAAYILESITDDGIRYNQSLHEGSGLSRIYAEKRLQVECGIKNSASDISYQLVSHKGEIAINAEGSWVRIKGKNICLEALQINLYYKVRK